MMPKEEVDSVVASLLKNIPELDPYLVADPAKKLMDDALFAHIHLSREVAGLGIYQGHQYHTTLSYAASILKRFPNNIKQKDIWMEHVKAASIDLEKASNRNNDAFKINGKRCALYDFLKTEERVLLPICWVPEPNVSPIGHAVLVEVQKMNADRYIIRVMNAGEGLNNHIPSYEAERDNQVIEYSYNEEDFKATVESISGILKDLKSHSFYECLRAKCPQPVVSAENSKRMLTGMCSWKMIMAFLKNRLGNHQAYLKVKQEIYIQSLVDYYLLYTNEPTAVRARHLEWAMNNVARFLTEKVKDTTLQSVQAGLKLCQDIQSTLKKKEWLKAVATSPIELDKSTGGVEIDLPDVPYIVENPVGGNQVPFTRKLNELNQPNSLKKLGKAPGAKWDINDLERAIAAIKGSIDASGVFQEELHDFVLNIPNFSELNFAGQDKMQAILKYQKSLRKLQAAYTEKVQELSDKEIKPEYILCSAKLFLDMMDAFLSEYPNVKLPAMVLARVDNYLTQLDSVQFYSLNVEKTNYWTSIKEKLGGLEAKEYYGHHMCSKEFSYKGLKKEILKGKYNIDADEIKARGNKKLCEFLVARDQAVVAPSVENPINLRNAIKCIATNTTGSLENFKLVGDADTGYKFYMDATSDGITNVADLVMDYVPTFIPEFTSDDQVVQEMWGFLDTENGVCYWRKYAGNVVYKKAYVDGGALKLSSPLRNFCTAHQHERAIFSQCSDAEKDVVWDPRSYYSACVQKPAETAYRTEKVWEKVSEWDYTNPDKPVQRQVDRQVDRQVAYKKPQEDICTVHKQPHSTCAVRTVDLGYIKLPPTRREKKPCNESQVVKGPVASFDYRTKFSLDTDAVELVSLDDFMVRPKGVNPNDPPSRSITADLDLLADNSVNKDVTAVLNHVKKCLAGNIDSKILNDIAWSTAFGVKEVQVENVLQYCIDHFPLLNDPKNVALRNSVAMVLLRPNAVHDFLNASGNSLEFLQKFVASYWAYVNANVENLGMDNFASFVTLLLKESANRGLELFGTLNNPFGKLMSFYYLIKSDFLEGDDRRKLDVFGEYCKALSDYSKSGHPMTDIETRFFNALQLEMFNISLMGFSPHAFNDFKASIQNQFVSKMPEYVDFLVTDFGYQKGYNTQVLKDSFVIKGTQDGFKKTISLNLKTGETKEIGAACEKLPDAVIKEFSDFLGDVKEARCYAGNYFFVVSGIRYCISQENGSYKLSRKNIGDNVNEWALYLNETEKNRLLPKNIPNFLKDNRYEFWVEKFCGSEKIYIFDKSQSPKNLAYVYQNSHFKKKVGDGFQRIDFLKSKNFESPLLSEYSESGGFLSFPRYNLSFNKNKDDFFCWDQKTDYKLVKLNNNTELGEGFDRFLALEALSDSSKRKVLIPCQSYIAHKQGLLPTDIEIEIELDTYGLVAAEKISSDINETFENRGNLIFHKKGSEKYIECELDANGGLTAQGIPDKMYLLYLFLGQSNYSRAFEILKEIEVSGYYVVDDTVKSHLSKILCDNIPLMVVTKGGFSNNLEDKSYNDVVLKNGKKSAIQLKMLVNLIRTNACAQSKQCTELFDDLSRDVQLKSLVDEYVLYYSNTPSNMRLSREESITLFDFMTTQGLNVSHYVKQAPFRNMKSKTPDVKPQSKVEKKTVIDWTQSLIGPAREEPEEEEEENGPGKDGAVGYIREVYYKNAILDGESKFDIDDFEKETAIMLKDLKDSHRNDSLEDKMDLDELCGQLIYSRDLELGGKCARIQHSDTAKELLTEEYLEHSLADYDKNIREARDGLLSLVRQFLLEKNIRGIAPSPKFLAGRLEKIDFRSLVQLFMQNDPKAYREKFGPLSAEELETLKLTDEELKKTELSEEELNKINEKMGSLLRLLTARQYYERAFNIISSEDKNPDKIGPVLQERRAYSLLDPNARYFLSFEYLSGLLIRPSQMKMLRLLLKQAENSEEHRNAVFQLIMGGGKSKVLMPVSGFLKSAPNRLVTVIVPESLLETNVYDLSRCSQLNFEQGAVPIRFKREDVNSTEKLELLRDRLKEMSANQDPSGYREYAVTSKVTLQSLELSYISLLTSAVDSSDKVNRIALLEEILNIFQNESDVFIDEIDTNLNCFDELNYTLEGLNNPPEYLIDLQVQFFQYLLQPTPARTLGNGKPLYDLLTVPNLSLNSQNFNKMIHETAHLMFNERGSFLNDALVAFDDEQSRVDIFEYLTTENKPVPDALKDCKDEKAKKTIAFCKAQFSSILPLILKKEENIHYGFSGNKDSEFVDSQIAIPYAGNNTPRESSRFSNLYETFGYTSLLHLKHGVSERSLEKYIKDFVEEYNERALKPGGVENELVQKFFGSLGFNGGEYTIKDLLKEDPKLIHEIWTTVKDNKAVVFNVIRSVVFEKVKLYPFMLNSNSSDFTSMLKVVQGASGTIDNPAILDPKIEFEKELSLGTDGKTIAVLRSDKVPENVLIVDSNDAKLYLKTLKELIDNGFENYQSIIDVGAHFKGVSNLDVAKGIAEFYHAPENPSKFKYVLYFNKNNLLAALPVGGGDPIEIGSSDAAVIKEKIKCNPDEYFVYFDQTHTVGTDIPLKKGTSEEPVGAKAFMSYGPKNTQPEVLQGAMRERDLASSQSLVFVGNQALADHLKSKNKLATKASVLRLARENLIEKIREEAFRAASQKIKAVYRRAVLDLVKAEHDIGKKQEILRKAEKCIFSSMELDPSILFLQDYKEQDTRDVLEGLSNRYATLVKDLFPGRVTVDYEHFYDDENPKLTELRDKANLVIDHCIKYCHEKTVALVQNDWVDVNVQQSEVEVQAQAEAQVQAEVEAENEVQLQVVRIEAGAPYAVRQYAPQFVERILAVSCVQDQKLYSNDGRNFALNEVSEMSNNEARKFIEKSSDLIFSPNLIASTNSNNFLQNFSLKPCYHALWIEDKNDRTQRSVVLLSDRDVLEVRKQLIGLNNLNFKFSLRTMSGDCVDSVNAIASDEDWKLRMDQARFFCGHLRENNEWLQKEMEEKLKFYRDFIAPYHPNTENTLKFLERQFKKDAIKAKPVKFTSPWISAYFLPERVAPANPHPKYFKEVAVPAVNLKERPEYAAGRYGTLYLNDKARSLLSYVRKIRLVVVLFYAIVLKVRGVFLNRTLKKLEKQGVKIDRTVQYKKVEWPKKAQNSIVRFYHRVFSRYETLKIQYEQATSTACRRTEPKKDRAGLIVPTIDEMIEQIPVPLVYAKPSGLIRKPGQRPHSPNSPARVSPPPRVSSPQ